MPAAAKARSTIARVPQRPYRGVVRAREPVPGRADEHHRLLRELLDLESGGRLAGQ
jgi:hypothetical protein